MKTRLPCHLALGLSAMFLIATIGCKSGEGHAERAQGTITMNYKTGAEYFSTFADRPGTRIAVLRPTVTINGQSGALCEHWRSLAQTKIEAQLRSQARRHQCEIEFVSTPDDLPELLDQQDRRIAGTYKSDGPAKRSLADREAYIGGSIQIAMTNDTEQKTDVRWNPLHGVIPYGEEKYLPYRQTSISAQLTVVANDGTHAVSYDTPPVPPLITRADHSNYVVAHGSTKPLPPEDDDIARAIDAIAPAFAAVIFPQQKRASISLESCGDEACSESVGRFVAARSRAASGDDLSAAIADLEQLAVTHAHCHRLQFALAIAYESAGDFDTALDALGRAIEIRGRKYDLSKPKERANQASDSYYLAEARIEARMENHRNNEEFERKQVENAHPSSPPVLDAGAVNAASN